MSKKKIILSILLLLFLIGVGIVLPYYLKQQREAKKPSADTPPHTEQAELPEDQMELSFSGFEDLEFFFSKGQIELLKEQFPLYFEQTGLTAIESITFLTDKSSYPSEDITSLLFQTDSQTMIPVYYSTSKGAFFFGKEKLSLQADTQTYELQTDNTLPSVTTEEIETMQEGGYDNTSKPADKPESEENTAEDKEVTP